MSDEMNAKPADKAPEPGETQTPTGEPASAAHASEPIPGGQYADPGSVYPVKTRTPVRVTAGRVIRSSAVGLVGAGLLGGLVGGGVVALADNGNGNDRRITISRQALDQGTDQQFPGRGQFQRNQQQNQQQDQQGGGTTTTPSY
jgi:hypothetical protein